MKNLKDNNHFNEQPSEIVSQIFSFLNLKNLKEVATVCKLFSLISKDTVTNIQNELKKTADELFKTNDEHMQNFLNKARKQNQQWLLDYCYQEAVKHYFSDDQGAHRKTDNRNQSILDWAIICLQPEKVIQPLFDSTPSSNDFDFTTQKLSLALRVESISTIKLLAQQNYEVRDTLEWLIINKKTATFKKLFPYFVKEQLLLPEDFISLLKLALLNTNSRAAKIILKEAPGVSEMISTRGEELFSNMPDKVFTDAKLVNYWKEKVVKLDAMNFKSDNSSKVSFFDSLLSRIQKQKIKEERGKLQVANKLIKRFIENDDSIVLTEKDLHLIKKSKKLTDIYSTNLALLEGNRAKPTISSI